MIGLTEKGLHLYLSERRLFGEHVVWKKRPMGGWRFEYSRVLPEIFEAVWRQKGFKRTEESVAVIWELAVQPLAAKDIGKRLKIDPKRLKHAIQYLLEKGLITKDYEDIWVAGEPPRE